MIFIRYLYGCLSSPSPLCFPQLAAFFFLSFINNYPVKGNSLKYEEIHIIRYFQYNHFFLKNCLHSVYMFNFIQLLLQK